MLYKLKALGLIVLMAGISSCGIFSNDKTLPSGTRVSILAGKIPGEIAISSIPADSLPAAVVNQNWTQNGGNANHVMGNIHASDTFKQKWKANFGEGASKRNLLLAAPIIFAGTVYAQDVKGTVRAFNLSDGKNLWKQKLKPLTENENDSGLNGSGLAADENAVYAAAGFGSVFALNPQDGKVLWRRDIGTPLRTAPAVCNDKVIIQTLDNRVFALSTQNGNEIWKYNISAEDTVLAGSPAPACLPDKNLVVTGFSNGEIQAFNADIGYPLWSATLIDNSRINLSTDINAVKASPVIEHDTIYAIGHNDLLAAIDYRTGENKWSLKIGGIHMPWIVGNYLFVLSNNNELFAVNKNDGKILWQTRFLEEYPLDERGDIYLSGPVMINSQLLITASNGIVYFVSPENGEIKNRLNFKEELPMTPVAAGNTVIFTTNDADLLAYK